MGDDSSSSSSAVLIENDSINNMMDAISSSDVGSIFLQIVEHPADGSITRPTVPNLPPVTSDVNPNSPVLSKDVPLNPTHNTKLRLYLPNPPPSSTAVNYKLPVVVYYHGGGFVLFSPDFILYHQFCEKMAEALPALIVSLDYRLAPEHRLPAAYEDAVEAIQWVKHSADPWIVNHADLSRCFVMGSSSGGNMAYFAGLRATENNIKLDHVRICGLVLIQPYFGGEQRTQSEMESEEDDILPLRANEMMWRLALPKGTRSRDHEYCNPAVNPPPADELVKLPATMVMGCRGDPLFDRQKMFVEMLEKAAPGMRLVARLDDDNNGGYHAVELFDAAKAQQLLAQIREFVVSA